MTIIREQGNAPAWFEQMAEPVHDPVVEGSPSELAAAAPGIEGMNDSLVKAVAAGEHPVMEPSPELTVELPRGLKHPKTPGVWMRQAEIRELTGRDEEYLARYKTEEEILDGIIALGTVSIGDLDLSKEPVSSRTATLGNLLVGERIMLYMAIVRATFGNEKELVFTCSSCETKNETSVLITEDFPFTVPDDIEEEYFSFLTRSGSRITYRPVTGADVLALSGKGNDKLSDSERNSRMLERIIINVDGEVPFNMAEYVRDLGMLDRTKLLAEVLERQPSVDWVLKIQCIGCHEEVSIPVTWGSLFRP